MLQRRSAPDPCRREPPRPKDDPTLERQDRGDPQERDKTHGLPIGDDEDKRAQWAPAMRVLPGRARDTPPGRRLGSRPIAAGGQRRRLTRCWFGGRSPCLRVCPSSGARRSGRRSISAAATRHLGLGREGRRNRVLTRCQSPAVDATLGIQPTKEEQCAGRSSVA